MITRDVAVGRAVELAKSNSYLILNWATGVGKSKAAISIAQDVNPSKILLIVAETAHKKNWEIEFEKWGKELWERTSVECYASLKNYKDTEWDLIILDEGHHAKSELRADVLSTIKAEQVVVLTATLSVADELILSTAFNHGFHRYTITLQDAIMEGILPTPKIYLLPLELDKESQSVTIEESWGDSKKRVNNNVPFERRFQFLNKKVWPASNLTIRCTPFQKYNYLTEKVEYFKRQFMLRRQEFLKNKWLQLGSARKRLLAELKTEVLRQLLNRFNEKRYICFCGSIEQADLLGGDCAIHSKKPNSLKTIEAFNKKEINQLIAVNMLQEGQNLIDIELGIIAQLDGQERAFIQKFGRTLRAEDPVQVILYFRGTRDEEYLEKALEGINPEYVHVVDALSEIEVIIKEPSKRN